MCAFFQRSNDDKELVDSSHKHSVRLMLRPYVKTVIKCGLTFTRSEEATNAWGALCKAISNVADGGVAMTNYSSSSNNSNTQNPLFSFSSFDPSNSINTSSFHPSILPSTKEALSEELRSSHDAIPQHLGQVVRKIVRCGGTREACENLDFVRNDRAATLCKLYVITRVPDLDWLFHANKMSPEESREARQRRRERRRERRRLQNEAQGIVPNEDDNGSLNNDDDDDEDDDDFSDYSYEGLRNGDDRDDRAGNNNDDDDDEELELPSIPEPNVLWFKVDPPDQIWRPYLCILLRETFDGLQAFLATSNPELSSFYDEDEEMEGRVCTYLEKNFQKCFDEIQHKTIQFHNQHQHQHQHHQPQQQQQQQQTAKYLASPLLGVNAGSPTMMFPTTSTNNNNAKDSTAATTTTMLKPSSPVHPFPSSVKSSNNLPGGALAGLLHSPQTTASRRQRNFHGSNEELDNLMMQNNNNSESDSHNHLLGRGSKVVRTDNQLAALAIGGPRWYNNTNTNYPSSAATPKNQIGLVKPDDFNPLTRIGKVVQVENNNNNNGGQDQVLVAWNNNNHQEQTNNTEHFKKLLLAGQIPVFRYSVAEVVEADRAAGQVLYFPDIEHDFLLWQTLLIVMSRTCLHRTPPREETVRSCFLLLRNPYVNPRVRTVATVLLSRWCLPDIDPLPWMRRPLHFVAAALKHALLNPVTVSEIKNDYAAQYRMGVILQRLCSIEQIQRFLASAGGSGGGNNSSSRGTVVCLQLVEFCWMVLRSERSIRYSLEPAFVLLTRLVQFKRCFDHLRTLEEQSKTPLHVVLQHLASGLVAREKKILQEHQVAAVNPSSSAATGDLVARTEVLLSQYHLSRVIVDLPSKVLALLPSSPAFTGYDLERISSRINDNSGSNSNNSSNNNNLLLRVSAATASSFVNDIDIVGTFLQPLPHKNNHNQTTFASFLSSTQDPSSSSSSTGDSSSSKNNTTSTHHQSSSYQEKGNTAKNPFAFTISELWKELATAPASSHRRGGGGDTNNNKGGDAESLMFSRLLNIATLFVLAPQNRRAAFCLLYPPHMFVDMIHRKYSLPTASSSFYVNNNNNNNTGRNNEDDENDQDGEEQQQENNNHNNNHHHHHHRHHQSRDLPLLWFMASILATAIEDDFPDRKLMISCLRVVLLAFSPDGGDDDDDTTNSVHDCSYTTQDALRAVQLWRQCDGMFVILNCLKWAAAQVDEAASLSTPDNPNDAVIALLALRCLLQIGRLTSNSASSSSICCPDFSCFAKSSILVCHNKLILRRVLPSINSKNNSSSNISAPTTTTTNLDILRTLASINDEIHDEAFDTTTPELPEVTIARSAIKDLVEGYLFAEKSNNYCHSVSRRRLNDNNNNLISPENSMQFPPEPSTHRPQETAEELVTVVPERKSLLISKNNHNDTTAASDTPFSLRATQNFALSRKTTTTTPFDRIISSYVYSSLEKSILGSNSSMHDDSDDAENEQEEIDQDERIPENDDENNERNRTTTSRYGPPISHVSRITNFKHAIRYPPGFPSAANNAITSNKHLHHILNTKQNLRANSSFYLPTNASSSSSMYYNSSSYTQASKFKLLPSFNHTTFSIHYSGEYPNDDGLQSSVARVFDNGETLIVGSHAGEIAIVGNLSTVTECCMDDELAWMPMLDQDTDITDIDYWTSSSRNNQQQQQEVINNSSAPPLLAVGSDRFVRIMRLANELGNGSDAYAHESLQQFNLDSQDGILGSCRISPDGKFLAVSCRHNSTQELIMLDIERGIDQREAAVRFAADNTATTARRWVPSAWKNATPTSCSFAAHRVNSSELFLHRGALFDSRSNSSSNSSSVHRSVLRLDRTDFANHSIFHPLDVNDATCISGRYVWDLRCTARPLVEIPAAENAIVHFAHGGRLIITGFRPEGGAAVPVAFVQADLHSTYEHVATMPLHGSPMEISVCGGALVALGDAVSPDIHVFGLYGEPHHEDRILFAKLRKENHHHHQHPQASSAANVTMMLDDSSSANHSDVVAATANHHHRDVTRPQTLMDLASNFVASVMKNNNSNHQKRTANSLHNQELENHHHNNNHDGGYFGDLFASDDLQNIYPNEEDLVGGDHNGNDRGGNNNMDDDYGNNDFEIGRHRNRRPFGRGRGDDDDDDDPDFDSDFDDEDEEDSDGNDLSEGSSWTADHFGSDNDDDDDDVVETDEEDDIDFDDEEEGMEDFDESDDEDEDDDY